MKKVWLWVAAKCRWKYLRVLFLAASIGYYFCLPEVLFDVPYSTILEDRNGNLLSAAIATDGQWRFPEAEVVPDKFRTALLAFEDKRFGYHPGVDPAAMGRAFFRNFQAGRVVSGGSTISMQVIRLSRKRSSRTVWEKIIEMVLATRLELRYSKDEILKLYATHAPFGGNVVGLEAACWRYFGRDPGQLSWGEAALLAVLPNAPALIHPGRNRDELNRKRNGLLGRLYEQGHIDTLTATLARQEPIPENPAVLPRHARHLLTRVMKEERNMQRVRSTVDLSLQQHVERILDEHHQRLKGNQIFNAAALVLSVESGEVLTYTGNVGEVGEGHGAAVDVITSPRSTGSILKPFLYAAMLDEGRILSGTLLPDVPTIVAGYSPQNFSNQYDGAVRADMALIRSLNVPAVHLLMDYRYEKFHALLKSMGMSTLTRPAEHYGLSIILGGAEGTLWDISGMYASMARTLNHYFQWPGKNKYHRDDYFAPTYVLQQREAQSFPEANSWLSAFSIYKTFDVLKELYRPGEESGWRYFSSAAKIAWKTGTSFGFRDGWAIGVTPGYVVGVWVGNADGEGRPGLTGTDAAAPVMFEIFSHLKKGGWFERPSTEMSRITVCSKSGMRNGEFCVETDTVWVGKKGLETQRCTYHRRIHLSADERFRVDADCYALTDMKAVNWFVLPPVQEYYFKARNISYHSLPPYKPGCQSPATGRMDLIYPRNDTRIYIPRELDGHAGEAIFRLAHQEKDASVFWHLDGRFVGITRGTHQLALHPGYGRHILTLVDHQGAVLQRNFEVLSTM